MGECINLAGITFVDLPHIEEGQTAFVIWEKGKPYDDPSEPAYSVRIDGGCHIGYIPKLTTVKEEQLNARRGLRKVGRGQWEDVGWEVMRPYYHGMVERAVSCELIRDFIRVDILRNHLIPKGKLHPIYNKTGDICSVVFEYDNNACNPLATQGSAAMEAFKASRHDQS